MNAILLAGVSRFFYPGESFCKSLSPNAERKKDQARSSAIRPLLLLPIIGIGIGSGLTIIFVRFNILVGFIGHRRFVHNASPRTIGLPSSTVGRSRLCD